MAIPMQMIIFALSYLFCISATFSIPDSPFIVSHKKANLRNLKSGVDRVSVSIDIYNSGSASAYDVSLTDNSWAQEVFDYVSGNSTKTWERLDVGSHVSHSFELISQVKTKYRSAPAVITFRVPTKAKLQEAYSTPILPLDILTEKTAAKKLELTKRFFMKYGSLISVICIVSLSGHLITSPSKSSDAKGNKKRR